MAIDDNASYELTGYQVKDLAGKVRAKADSSSLASVATSGLYSDLVGAPTIPTVYNGTLTIQQNGTQLGTFSANQSSNTTINITGGGGASYTAGNGINIDANNEISIDDTVVAELVDIPGVMIGATPSAPGVGGTVPAPAPGDDTKFLSGDGTWKTVSGGTSTPIYIDFDYNTPGRINLYKDAQLTTTATGQDLLDNLQSGNDVIGYFDGGGMTYHTMSMITDRTDGDSYFLCITGFADAGSPGDASDFITTCDDWLAMPSQTYLTMSTETHMMVAKVADITFDSPSAGSFEIKVDNTALSGTQFVNLLSDYYGRYRLLLRSGYRASYDNYRNTYHDVISWATSTVGNTRTYSFVINSAEEAPASEKRFVRLEITPSATSGTYTVVENQEKLTAGSNITISGNTISATDTTYSAFTGATSGAAGTSGLVPAPLQSERNKVLRGDGTWGAPTKTRFWSNGTSVFNNFSMGISARVTGQEIADAFSDGDVDIVWINPSDMSVPYTTLLQSLDTRNGAAKFMFTTPDSDGEDAIEIYYADATTKSCTITHKKWQEELIAGTNVSIAADGKTISATDTTYSNFTGATSSVAGAAGLVPAPAAGDESKALHGDGTWKDTTAKLVEMSYGESNAWAKFIAAYNAGSIVYCRASSNANPGTGSQTRKAFMAYVNNATNPTNVEFQYVRSQSSKTDSQQTDQVFVYTLTNTSGGTWSVASRNMGPKIVAGTGMSSTFTTGANATITLNAEPNYSTSEVDTKVKWIDGKTIYRKTINYGTLPDTTTQFVNHNISSLGNVIKIEGFMTEGTVWRTLPYADGSFDSVYVTSTQVGIYTTADMTAWSAYVTLYYTKSS